MNDIPQFLLEILNKQYGEDLTTKIVDGFSRKRKLTFRANTLKTTTENVEEVLKENNIEFEKVKFSKEAFIINNVEKSKIEELEIYKNGQIYLQSLSSMLPPIVLNPKENVDILDMAAAPRG